ncbi:glycosyl-phosphatidylinositol-anchored molecule-like protein, partial [Carlito syrichta]|uniref:Glycosyl-phosphatidylinositol-anchored molecule-like protein n=1 Tax=Carlito syrichta TaxID=1868482 RepID=A0A1U7TCG5_CARSF
VHARLIIGYSGCTWNCSFMYTSEMPPEAPRKITKVNSFYWYRCCSSMQCNGGGPTNLEKDMLPDYTLEEEVEEGTVRLGTSPLFLIFASIIVSHALL